MSRYAEDLREDACIDAAVAYGIALDTFLGEDTLALSVHPIDIRYILSTNCASFFFFSRPCCLPLSHWRSKVSPNGYEVTYPHT